MGILSSVSSFLFGDAPEAEISSRTTHTPEQQSIEKELAKMFKTDTSPGVESYVGDLVAPLSQLEQTSLAGLEQEALNRVNSGSALIDSATQAIIDTINADPTNTDDYYQTNVFDPAYRQLTEKTLPGLDRRKGLSYFGSERREQETDLKEAFNRDVLGERADLAFKTAESQADRRLRAAEMAPGVSRSTIDEFASMLAAGEVPRGVKQAELAVNYDKFLNEEERKRQRIDQMLALLGYPGLENIATVTEGSPGFLTSVASGVASGAARGYFGRGG